MLGTRQPLQQATSPRLEEHYCVYCILWLVLLPTKPEIIYIYNATIHLHILTLCVQGHKVYSAESHFSFTVTSAKFHEIRIYKISVAYHRLQD